MAGRDDVVAIVHAADVEPIIPVSFSASAMTLDATERKGETALGPELPVEIEAWSAYDAIGEVGTLVSSSAGLLSQCKLYPGFIDSNDIERRLRDSDGKPVEGFDERIVADSEAVLARYVDSGGSQRELISSVSENFDVTGRAFLVGWPIDDKGKPWHGPEREKTGERWEVVGRKAIGKKRDQFTIQLSDRESATALPRESTLIVEMKRKHPREPALSRGWVIAALDACRDLRVFTLAQRSAGRSSIPSSILLAPSEASPKDLKGAQHPSQTVADMAPLGGPNPKLTPEQSWAATLERLIGDAVMEVLNDAQSGRAVIPAVLSVAEKYVGSFDKIDLSRPIDEVLGTLVDQARARVAESADCPPEMLRGLGETNRWNGAQIADDEYRRYFKPKADTIAAAWTAELLWKGLADLGYKAEQYRKIRVLVDATGVVAPPDKTELATTGLKLGALGFAAWRKACGFDEDDAPTPEEQALLLTAFGKGTGQATDPAPEGAVDMTVGSGGLVLPEPMALDPVPLQITAAGPSTLETLAMSLAEIENETRARIEEACEAALDQMTARVGAKLKSWARADHDLRPFVAGYEARDVPAALGPERCAAIVKARGFSADDGGERNEELYAAALLAALNNVDKIHEDGFAQAVELLGGEIVDSENVPLSKGKRFQVLRSTITKNLAAARDLLAGLLTKVADSFLFGKVARKIGESSRLRVPTSVVRRVMAAAGGGAVAESLDATVDALPGLVFGPTLAEHEPSRIGFRWVYGVAARAHPWEPHQRVNGRVFSGPDDDGLAGLAPGGGRGFPGDHSGCRCTWVPVFDEASGALDAVA